MLWPIVALIVGGVAVALFLRWYYQAPSPPGNTPNAKLVAMFNERLERALDRLTPSHAPGLSPLAAHSARAFLSGVAELTQHCRYQHRVTVHNLVVFDLTLNDGSVAKDLYSGGQRCPGADMPGVPILRIRFKDGRAVEITSDGSERQALPATVVPALDQIIKHVISYDQGLRPGAYFKASASTADMHMAWASPPDSGLSAHTTASPTTGMASGPGGPSK
ncbi:MAG: hypothetical protein IPO19_12585 [Rhodoferax sp.]|nr:hypothetical protein [Rhodoferax sp.]